MNRIGIVNASFNARDMTYAKPMDYAKAHWYCIADGTKMLPGDYLVGTDDQGVKRTWFITDMPDTLPIQAVLCNSTIALGRMPSQMGAGNQGYSGEIQQDMQAIFGALAEGEFVSGWPCSMLIGGRSDAGSLLPSGVKMSGVTILLPPSLNVEVLESDRFVDENNLHYEGYSIELTALGYRILANNWHA